MKVTKYITTADAEFRKSELKPCGSSMAGAKTVTVEDTPVTENFLGFGVALTDSSCYMLNTMDDAEREAFLKDIYSPEGLNLSVARLSVGSSDYSPYLYSYDDVENDTELKHFSVERDEEFILPMIKKVTEVRGDIYFFSSPWSPPAWMKTSDSLCGGHMRRKFLEVYADYYVKYLKSYAQYGINISALTPQNESETDQKGTSVACVWHPELEAEFILLLRKKLSDAGLNTEIWMYDHDFQMIYRVDWCLKEYPELSDAADGVALHYYSGGIECVDGVIKKYPQLSFHFTEGGPRLYDNYGSDWCKWGIMIEKALNHGCKSFTGWNLLLDELGGPNIGPFFCGGLATINSADKTLTYSGQYKAFRHFSHFTQKGASVMKCSVGGDGQRMFSFDRKNANIPVSVCAIKNKDGSLALHITNANNYKYQLQYFYGGKWWYIECLPDSVNTVLFEN